MKKTTRIWNQILSQCLAGVLDGHRMVPTPFDLSRLLCYSSRLSKFRYTIYTVRTLEGETLHIKDLFRVRMKPGVPS
jgi:hypothetical protein